MDWLVDFFHQIRDPQELIKQAGTTFVWGSYLVMAIIVFTETGLMFGFFLPGDSLMVVAGILCTGESPALDLLTVNLVLIPAAILGDSLGYAIGLRAGPALYSRPDSRFFKKEHLVAARDFYERHGGKTIIIARFVPIVRTFAPVVAGAANMDYARFLQYNVVGAVAWVTGLTLVGYLLGNQFPDIGKKIDILVVVVVGLSMLPIIIPFVSTWWANRGAKATAKPEAAESAATGKPIAETAASAPVAKVVTESVDAQP